VSWDLRPWRSGSTRPRVLCVDDEQVILRVLGRLLALQGFEADTCDDPVAAASKFDPGTYDVVITDVDMPGMDGLALTRALRSREPDLPVIIVTGHGTMDTAIQALREGATGMLLKPFTGEELLAEVCRALSTAQMRYEAVQYRYLSPVLDSIALTLSSAIEARNLETGEHCRQLGVLSERMANLLGLDGQQQMTIRIGGYLHDIGKIGIADAVLLKPGLLTADEMFEIRRHAEIGASILEVHGAMSDIALIVRHHHERWDGNGYPAALAGPEIPIGGRIIAVADAFNAMTSDRPYRLALPPDRAWAELRANSGTQFDPAVVEVFGRVVDEEGRLRRLNPDVERKLNGEIHVPIAPGEESSAHKSAAVADPMRLAS
jgi:putative two-component system response regulator